MLSQRKRFDCLIKECISFIFDRKSRTLSNTSTQKENDFKLVYKSAGNHPRIYVCRIIINCITLVINMQAVYIALGLFLAPGCWAGLMFNFGQGTSCYLYFIFCVYLTLLKHKVKRFIEFNTVVFRGSNSYY